MDDFLMGGLFPMPDRSPLGTSYIYPNHAKLWKRRRLRLEAEQQEAQIQRSRIPKEQATGSQSESNVQKPLYTSQRSTRRETPRPTEGPNA